MAEYIDRDLTEKALMERCNETGYGGLNRTDVKMVMRTPWRIPNADVVPRKDYESMERTVDKLNKALAERKHGKWNWIGFNIECSECGAMPNFDSTEPLYNFCPNCGADMRESEGEE